jgi:hypothetical protein
VRRGLPLAAIVAALAASDGARAQIAPASGLLEHLAQSRWAVNGACATAAQVYRLEHRGTTVTWFDWLNGTDVEEIRQDAPFEALTVTVRSNHAGGTSTPIGTTWRYQLQSEGRVNVEKSGRAAFFIARCPG